MDRVKTRTGGRSARIRADVIAATQRILLDEGYEGVTHQAVARLAEVNSVTVYRRWETRAHLATDALLDLADHAVPVPDTGSFDSDLRALHNSISQAISERPTRRLMAAFISLAAEGIAEVKEVIDAFWDGQFAGTEVIVDRAVTRGELPAGTDPRRPIEQLVSPIYFRSLISGLPCDEAFTESCLAAARAAASDPDPADPTAP